jgi:hypothetical protein
MTLRTGLAPACRTGPILRVRLIALVGEPGPPPQERSKQQQARWRQEPLPTLSQSAAEQDESWHAGALHRDRRRKPILISTERNRGNHVESGAGQYLAVRSRPELVGAVGSHQSRSGTCNLLRSLQAATPSTPVAQRRRTDSTWQSRLRYSGRLDRTAGPADQQERVDGSCLPTLRST